MYNCTYKCIFLCSSLNIEIVAKNEILEFATGDRY